jgi:transcriptional regulator with XRE-family HTH domain
MAAASQDPTVQRRRLRTELRNARDAAGLKQAEVAIAMDWSPSKLIRIEGGQVSVSTNDLRALLSFYGVKEQARINSLLELAKAARATSFFDQYDDILKAGFKDYLAYEGSASVIRQYDPMLVSGLLQTEEYARAILGYTFNILGDHADRVWAVRQHRQEVHDREDPPDMIFIIDESSIRRQVGGVKVMPHQLERLREFAAMDHITLRVLPFAAGAHPGMAGNFILLEFDDPSLRDMVHLESIDSITIRDDIDVIGLYLERFVRLEARALSVDDSDAFLVSLIDELSTAPEVGGKGITA